MSLPPEYRLHHVGVLVREIEAAAAWFERMLGYRRVTPVIPDAPQTARVLFLEHPAQRHWLELVTPDGASGKLTAALERGPGAHHLAFEVPALPEAIGRLRADGCLPLGHPAPGAAFGGRPIAWMYSREAGLIELVERGPGPLALADPT